MLFLDIETLSVESTAVILSIGALHISDTSPAPYTSLLNESIFIKLNAKEQIDKYNRTVSKDTLKWWSEQSDFAKKLNYTPSKEDWGVEESLTTLENWINKVSDKNTLCWIRGTLDQVCLDSLYRAAGKAPPIGYNKYRDIRTAIDFLYPDTSKNGYVDVDPELCLGFDRDQVLAHHPVHDCARDCAMMLYGKN
jgi:hypothetical protein